MNCRWCGREIHKNTKWERWVLRRYQRLQCYPATKQCYDSLRDKMDLPPSTPVEWLQIVIDYKKKGEEVVP